MTHITTPAFPAYAPATQQHAPVQNKLLPGKTHASPDSPSDNRIDEKSLAGERSDVDAMLQASRMAKNNWVSGSSHSAAQAIRLRPHPDSPVGADLKQPSDWTIRLSENPAFQQFCEDKGLNPNAIGVTLKFGDPWITARDKANFKDTPIFNKNTDALNPQFQKDAEQVIAAAIRREELQIFNGEVSLEKVLQRYGIAPSNPKTLKEWSKTITALKERHETPVVHSPSPNKPEMSEQLASHPRSTVDLLSPARGQVAPGNDQY